MLWANWKNFLKIMCAYLAGEKLLNFYSYVKYKRDYSNAGSFRFKSENSFAIVMQGPVISTARFTIESLKIYRHNFPDAILILSTWSVGKTLRDELRSYGVHLIQNKEPKNPGISNINMQILTSKSGVLLAEELGVKYVLKTRADQRIYHPSFFAYLKNLLKLFPLEGHGTLQRERLIGISLGTFKYRIYGLSDMFLFGHIDDMLLYWNIPLDPRLNTFNERSKAGKTWKEFAMWRVCETYLCAGFLARIGYALEDTLTDSFNVLGKHFVIIDSEAIKLFWNKYTLNADRYAAFGFFDPQISFNDWLMLYEDADAIEIDHSIIDQPITQSS